VTCLVSLLQTFRHPSHARNVLSPTFVFTGIARRGPKGAVAYLSCICLCFKALLSDVTASAHTDFPQELQAPLAI